MTRERRKRVKKREIRGRGGVFGKGETQGREWRKAVKGNPLSRIIGIKRKAEGTRKESYLIKARKFG